MKLFKKISELIESKIEYISKKNIDDFAESIMRGFHSEQLTNNKSVTKTNQ